METHIVKILSAEPVTHDVRRFKVAKPEGYSFIPGQATEVAINHPRWKEERRPFTFTALNDWDHLEFTIKIYDDHDGVTHQLGTIAVGEELILHDVWGAIQYTGKGTFIAGGAGVTPFIAIFRQLAKDGQAEGNTLLFSNKRREDIILKEEFEQILGDRFINTLTQEKVDGYDHRMIDASYLREHVQDFNQHFYICGPDPMVQAIQGALKELGASESIITVEM